MTTPVDSSGQNLAVKAEMLYIINLMLAPGLGFLLLALLWRKHRHDAPPLARNHLAQTFIVSLWGAVLLVLACGLIVLLGGLDRAWTWVVVVLYFTVVHSTLILFGVLGLAKAMAGTPYVYPLIGVRDSGE
jgi:uncharacterized Tic20 family protein